LSLVCANVVVLCWSVSEIDNNEVIMIISKLNIRRTFANLSLIQ
jgi:hypothetical protein